MQEKQGRWGWYERISFYTIRNKWPQLKNYKEGQALFCNKTYEERKEFSLLVDIAVNPHGEETIKTCDVIPLIKKFKVANWPTPKELAYVHFDVKSLDDVQKQSFIYFCYWLGLQVPGTANPKYHAPIPSKNYEGLAGKTAYVRMTGTGRAWRRGEKARQYKS